MSKIKYSVFIFAVFFMQYGCIGQAKTAKEGSNDYKSAMEKTDVDSLAMQFLYDKIENKSKSILENGELKIDETLIKINSTVEFDNQKDENWIYAGNYSTKIRTPKETEINIGSIGIGNSREEAIMVSIEEWFAVFGVPLTNMLNNEEGLEVSELLVFSGLMGIRGTLPEKTWLNGGDEMNMKIINQIREEINSKKEAIIAIDIKLMIGDKGIVDGECRLGNKVSKKLLKELMKMEWPSSQEGYLFKQFYLVTKN